MWNVKNIKSNLINPDLYNDIHVGNYRNKTDQLKNLVTDNAMKPLTEESILLKISVPSEAQNVSLIRCSTRRLLEDLNFDSTSIEDGILAVGETCNIAVLHGVNSPGQTLEFLCAVVDSPFPTLVIEVKNPGTKLVDILNDSLFNMPLAEKMSDHGRGLPLMRKLMDKVTVYKSLNSTVVRLEKILPGSKNLN